MALRVRGDTFGPCGAYCKGGRLWGTAGNGRCKRLTTGPLWTYNNQEYTICMNKEALLC